MRFKKYHRAGTAPGTLVPPLQAPPRSRLILVSYGSDHYQENQLQSVEECLPFREKPFPLWLNVEGLGQVEVLEKLGTYFQLHPLALEDILNIGQRPKFDDYDDYLFMILRLAVGAGVETEQIGLFLGKDFLITVEERIGNGFEPVRERLRKGRPQIRRRGPDYLAYALIDSAVDSFFPVLERLGAKLQELDAAVMEHPTEDILQQIHNVKQELLILRRVLWPSRDMIGTLIRDDTPLIQPQTDVYLRDCYDHAVEIMDTVETYRDQAAGIMDVYLSTLSKHLNEVIKVLTIISTIFIPLTFMVGIYGMNFDPQSSPWNMPELSAYYGYPVALAVMAMLALSMIAYFKRRGWI